MTDPEPGIEVDEVIIPATELARRPSRPPDHAAEARALAALSEAMATSPETVLQRLVEVVLELTASDSAGVSILEEQDGTLILRSRAIAGAFAANLNGTRPPTASPCATAMARNQVLLFNEAERSFPDLREAKPRIYENLLAPFQVGGRPAGTIWAIKHRPEGRFESEDARLLARLAHVASVAYQMTTALAEAKQGREELERRVEGRTRGLTRTTERLAANEERFRRAMGIGTVGVLFFTLDGRMTEANEAFERMSGYSRDELIACEHWETLTPPEFRQATARAAAELVARGETEPYEKQMIRKDGSRWWGLFAPTRLSGSGPEAECFEFIIDITERKRAEEAWRRFATLAESSSEFIGMCD